MQILQYSIRKINDQYSNILIIMINRIDRNIFLHIFVHYMPFVFLFYICENCFKNTREINIDRLLFGFALSSKNPITSEIRRKNKQQRRIENKKISICDHHLSCYDWPVTSIDVHIFIFSICDRSMYFHKKGRNMYICTQCSWESH